MQETEDHFGRALLWRNGKVVSAGEDRVSPWDRGLTIGMGVFETMLAVQGEVFAFDRHDVRLRHSAQRLGLPVPPESVLRELMTQVLDGIDWPRARVRVTVTAGPAGGPVAEVSEPTVLVSATPVGAAAATARLACVPWTRNERGALVGVKTTSYAENMVALNHARQQGADEALWLNTQGDLCEGSGSNLFLVIDGGLHTPPLESGCLAGVTRALVIAWAREMGIALDESPCRPELLGEASAVFLTSTTRGVQPVCAVDERRWETPCPVTARLQERMAQALASEESR